MMLFSVAIAVTRQIEAGALRRLRLTRATAFDLMGGISLLYILIALLSVALAYLTALGFGFRSQGPLWLAILINVIAAIAVIGVGLMTACFSNTTARAAVIVNFPLMLLLFFSGAVFPVPDVALFTLGGHTFKLFELLPHTHAVVALNKVLSLGAGLSEVGFELGALVILTVVYFLAGIVMFQRMQFRSN
jgi:ABC-2 type transport system permease protein